MFVVGLVTSGRWARATAARTASMLMADELRVPVGAMPTAKQTDG